MSTEYELTVGGTVDIPGQPSVSIDPTDSPGVFRVGDRGWALLEERSIFDWADLPGTGLEVRYQDGAHLPVLVRQRGDERGAVMEKSDSIYVSLDKNLRCVKVEMRHGYTGYYVTLQADEHGESLELHIEDPCAFTVGAVYDVGVRLKSVQPSDPPSQPSDFDGLFVPRAKGADSV